MHPEQPTPSPPPTKCRARVKLWRAVQSRPDDGRAHGAQRPYTNRWTAERSALTNSGRAAQDTSSHRTAVFQISTATGPSQGRTVAIPMKRSVSAIWTPEGQRSHQAPPAQPPCSHNADTNKSAISRGRKGLIPQCKQSSRGEQAAGSTALGRVAAESR